MISYLSVIPINYQWIYNLISNIPTPFNISLLYYVIIMLEYIVIILPFEISKFVKFKMGSPQNRFSAVHLTERYGEDDTKAGPRRLLLASGAF